MAKFADYYISEVRYNIPHTHIIEVGCYSDNNGSFGQFQNWTKDQVISLIERGFSFITITFNAQEKKWFTGAKVRVIRVGSYKYIRTDENYVASDNLENLPEY